jgi:hypothetical protein
MVRRMKDLNSIAERFAMHQPIEGIIFRKSDKENFPRELKVFKPLLRSRDPRKVKIALAIFRSVEVFYLPPDHDISTVKQLPTYELNVIKDILKYIPLFVRKLNKLLTVISFIISPLRTGLMAQP